MRVSKQMQGYGMHMHNGMEGLYKYKQPCKAQKV